MGKPKNLFNEEELDWKHYQGGKDFDYHINYSDAVLDAREDGRLEILVKWEPNSYCHLHKHTADTSSVVLKGELHVSDFDIETGKETNKRIRNVGDFVHKEAGDIHMEKGGPEGALVLFTIFDPSGQGNLAESITKSGKVISSSNIKNILKRISN